MKVHGVRKAITLPYMPAFFVHRLVTARFGDYRDRTLDAANIRRNYKQAALVAKKIAEDNELKEELVTIIDELSEDQRQKMLQGATEAEKFIKPQDLTKEDFLHIQQMTAIDELRS